MSFLYIVFFNASIAPIHDFFPDSHDYLVQSKQALSSTEFWSPKPYPNFCPRPFTIPLIYKIAGYNPAVMVWIQKIIYALSAVFFSFSFFSFIKSNVIKTVFLMAMLFFFTWWNILGWAYIILSESLSMSYLFLWFAGILTYFKNKSNINFSLVIGITILLSFTRDTWPYIILLAAVLAGVFVVFRKKKNEINHTLIYLGFSLILFFIQNHTSSVGERYKIPLFNTIAGRIIKNEHYLSWFVAQGMPLSTKLVEDFKNIEDVDAEASRHVIYGKYWDQNYQPLFQWITQDGKKVFQQFVIQHPSYFFMLDQPRLKIDRILCKPYFGYVTESKNFHLLTDKVFPLFSLPVFLFILGIMVFMYFKDYSSQFLFLIVVSILILFNALLSYNADTLEVKRHLFFTQIMLDLIALIGVFLIVDKIRYTSKKFVP